MFPHAGEKVKEYLKASGMSVSEFARQLNCHRQNVYDIFKRQDIDLPKLKRISKILKHDFVTELYGPKSPMVTLKFSVTVEIAEDGQYKITEVQTVK